MDVVVPADGPVFATTALLGLLQITLETGLYLALAAGVARAVPSGSRSMSDTSMLSSTRPAGAPSTDPLLTMLSSESPTRRARWNVGPSSGVRLVPVAPATPA